MKKLLFILLLATIGGYSQNLKFTTDTIEVYDGLGLTYRYATKTHFHHLTKRLFTLDCVDRRVYSFILPNSQFSDYSVITFNDSGYLFNMSDSSSTIVTDTSGINMNQLGVLYESLDRPTQVIVLTNQSGIKVIKKDKTYIRFF